jgi:calcium-translocating P-type ATPase
LLRSDADGLAPEEARERLARFGRNSIPREVRPPVWRLVLRQFRSALIYLLLAAAAVSLAIGHTGDAGFILAVLAFNAAIGAAQEGRAAASADALRSYVRQTARVTRSGAAQDIDATALVPGDIVLLESGAHVPADLRLVQAGALQTNESLLTGEAFPVAKSVEAIADESALPADRSNMAFAGTSVVEGRGMGLVVATGAGTELGRIGASLLRAAPPPPLMRYIERLSRQIGIAILVLIALLGTAMLLRGTAPSEVFMLAVALAVAGIPEGLPVAVTVTLATATHRMARRNVIVRTLPAVEGLGACTLVATDKTGTLTVNRLSVEAVVLASGSVASTAQWSNGAASRDLQEIATAAALCNEAARSPEGDPVGDSVDVALLRFADAVGAVDRDVPRLALFAYEPVNRFASVAVADDGHVTAYAKGALETVLAMCSAAHPQLLAQAERLAKEGYRVLALARGSFASLESLDLAAPSGLVLLGCVALLDPLRPEAAAAVARCRDAGIDVRMITGDHPSTALTIAAQLGLADTEGCLLTGTELETLAPLEADRRIAEAKVFARITPAQKLAIVEALQRAGHVVAVTGDGVNDAPALHAAQIGVAMGRGGTDVARDASDLILADDNFASIVAGVEEGRITFANLRRIVVFLLATAIAEIGMFVGAFAVGLPLPLTPIQLLWANLVTEGAQTATLGFGKGDGDELHQRPRGSAARLLEARSLMLMLPAALLMTACSLALLDWVLDRGGSLAEARNAALLSTVLFQNVFALSIRSDRLPIWRIPLASNPWLLLGIAGALLLQLAAMAVPALATALGTSLPDLPTLGLCLASALAVLVALETTKAALRHGEQQRRSQRQTANG